MKTIALLLVLVLSTPVFAQITPDSTYGWLAPGHMRLEFGHRVASSKDINPVIDKYFRGKFVFWWWKPIYSHPKWMIDLTAAPQLIYGGFHERQFLLPAFNFRGELAFRFHWNQFLDLFVSSLHYSTHLVDDLPLSSQEDLLQLQQTNVHVDDINVLRIGATLRIADLGPLNEFYGHAGTQPIKLNYWFIGGGDLMFKKSSYSNYDRKAYFELQTDIILGSHRILLKSDGEFWETIRYIIELRWSTQLAKDPAWDGLQLFLSYEGANIAPNEIAITPYNGVSRIQWVVGFRISN